MRLILALALLLLSGPGMAADCTLVSHVCVDGPSTKTISGYPVTRDCWQFHDTYSCQTPTTTSDCQPLIDRGCSQINTTCLETSNLDGSCVLYEDKYQCVMQQGQTRTVKDCGTQTYCTDGNCFDTSYTNDGDITQVIAGMEALRETGVYFDQNSTTVFNGTVGKCTRTLGGLFNCCGKKVQAGVSNNSWMPNVAFQVGKEAIRWVGSNYMYDMLFTTDAPNWMFAAAEKIVPLDSSLDFAPSIWGVTMGFSASQAPASAITSWAVGNGQMFISFDPYSFAAQVAFYMLQELMSCDQKEQLLSIKRGASLCNSVGSYCSKKILGVCLQKTESYCCYNSKIAKIVNASGRAQLGIGYGSSKSPNCSGFTVDQLQHLDFSQMDFSEMTGDIQNKMRSVDPSFASERASTKVPGATTQSVQPYKSQGYFAP